MNFPWRFWIDVGGTFTDCIGTGPDGQSQQHKTLSSGLVRGTVQNVTSPRELRDPARTADPADFWTGAHLRLRHTNGEVCGESKVRTFDAATGSFVLETDVATQSGLRYELDAGLPAPVLGIRWLLNLPANAPVPAVDVRLGTTRGTNALLTRSGARTALITTAGFADVPLIGNQDRPDLFDLNIRKPAPLFESVVEVDERVAADGRILQPLDVDQVRQQLKTLRDSGMESLAVCLLHGWIQPQHEQQICELAEEADFREISHSHEVSPQIRFVPRCDTTVLDAYLNPVLRSYLTDFRRHLPDSRLLMMTSSGGLVEAAEFRGRDSILSGPAGGVVGFSRSAEQAGFPQAIGFDMGGTSTDVARYGGRFDYEHETTKAGVRIMTPMLAIETVAAGGGSLCGFDGVRLHVGPASAGASPGPACYGAGGPLTVTDLNVWLGRVLPEHFPFELDRPAIGRRLHELQQQMQAAGSWNDSMSPESLAEGLLQIANDNMVHAIRRVSVSEGYDPADHVLVSFGGAGGQHAVSVARSLGISHVLLHPLAGILSAWGMGQADVRQRRVRTVLKLLCDASLLELTELRDQLISDATSAVRRQGIAEDQVSDPQVDLELRYTGTESSLPVAWQDVAACRQTFEQKYRHLFGYIRSDRDIEIAAINVEVCGHSAASNSIEDVAPTRRPAIPNGTTQTIFNGEAVDTAVFLRESLNPGDTFHGPAILCEPTSTILVEPDCEARLENDGSVHITVGRTRRGPGRRDATTNSLPDPILLEVYNNQFVSIAEQMGETLRRTSVSTNVRERLDFSCAVFDSDGQLVVNAPHVPVHLGAMGETVRAVMQDHAGMQPGDVFVTNDPFRGGSHLPDVTVITPVFATDSTTNSPDFYVANRAHHAEIGGIVPGSMPPFSRNLAEEGVLIRSQYLVRGGETQEDRLRTLLSSGSWPSRNVDDNLADLAAQVAANACGARLLQELCATQSATLVQQYMQHVQTAAEQKMRLALSRLDDRSYSFRDQLDDGTVLCVCITVQKDSAVVDFTGTADVHPGNLNANRAITTAAVLYVFRCLLNEDVPLNAGVLTPLTLILPPGLLNPPAGRTPESCPAMVGGNVETSQRIVDVLLGALQLAAASQGTMNNLTFGNDQFGYYETICGGSGATPTGDGTDAVHTHMTNTRLTDPEILEQRYPVRLKRFAIRRDSGGRGQHRGGDGIEREIEFLTDLRVSMLSQRRQTAPWGLLGGASGASGHNSLAVPGQPEQDLEGAFTRDVAAGEVLTIRTPGGGGLGSDAPC